MKMGFLGTAAAISTATRDNTALVFKTKDLILIDCPGNVCGKLKSMGFDPMNVNHVVITHGHVDHIYGLSSLVEMLRLMGRKEELKIYVGEDFTEMVQGIMHLFRLYDHQEAFPVVIEPIPYRSGYSVELNGAVVSFMPVKHTLRNLAVRLEYEGISVTYSSDTEPLEELGDFSRGSKALIHEATRSYRLNGPLSGHSCAGDAGKIAERAGVEMLYLVHIGDFEEHELSTLIEEAAEHFEGQIIIPNDLEVVEL